MTVHPHVDVADHNRRSAAQAKVLAAITAAPADAPCLITVQFPSGEVQVHQGPGWKAARDEPCAPLAEDV